MDLSDDGVAGDPAQLAGDLAGAEPFGPKSLQHLDAFVSPAHQLVPGLLVGALNPFPFASHPRDTFGSLPIGVQSFRRPISRI